MAESQPESPGFGPAAAIARMPTGTKIFLILLGFLLPLALIALFMTLRTTRIADVEAQTRLRIAAEESSTILDKTLGAQVTDLQAALAAMDRNPDDAPSCTRATGTFAGMLQNGVKFAIANRRGELLCGTRFSVSGTQVLRPGEVDATIAPGQGLTVRIGGSDGTSALAYYPVAALASIARPSGFVPEYGAALVDGDLRLQLRSLTKEGPLVRRENIVYPLGLDNLRFEMTMPGAPINGPLMIATLLPLLMWLAAAGIGWFVVDRLLIRPLRRLRTAVGNFKPGEVIEPERHGALPAQELRDLGDTFREISRTVQLHEADLAEGLVRQTRLTREVHHRVKNNLQVISSLINFHARGARSEEATEAYASIQRRVDALAVVHRHHYAELEENRGLELRSVLGELASNLRATASARHGSFGITLEIDPFLVNQDVAVAVAFLITEIVELALNCNDAAQVRISVKPAAEEDRAVVRVVSGALVEGATHDRLVEDRYGRVMSGLARQLRTKLHHDPLVGAYEATIAVTGRS